MYTPQFVDIGNKQLGYDFTTVVYRSSNSISEPQIKMKLTAEFSFDFKDYICENCIKVFEAYRYYVKQQIYEYIGVQKNKQKDTKQK